MSCTFTCSTGNPSHEGLFNVTSPKSSDMPRRRTGNWFSRDESLTNFTITTLKIQMGGIFFLKWKIILHTQQFNFHLKSQFLSLLVSEYFKCSSTLALANPGTRAFHPGDVHACDHLEHSLKADTWGSCLPAG